MRRLNELIDKVSQLEGGMKPVFPSITAFLSVPENKRKLITTNQEQLFHGEVNRDGKAMGTYSPRVRQRKIRAGLPSGNYTLYNTGTYFTTMDLTFGENYVEIICVPSGGAGIDAIGRGVKGVHTPEGIEWMFRQYDPGLKSLGLSNDSFRNFVETSGIKENLVTEIKNYLNG